MYNILIQIIYIVSVIKVAVSDGNELEKDDYISQETEESGINEVLDDRSSKEDYDSSENATEKIIFHSTVTSPPENISLSASPKLPGKYAFNTVNCNDKKVSGSEENICKSTLVNYPYSASIQRKGAHYASGALVNARSVLTAAGVFYYVRESIKLFRVRLGSVDCKKGGVVRPIKKVSIHPSYEYRKSPFDVAVLRLAEAVQLSDYIKPISFTRVKQDVISAKFLTTYWPRIVVDGSVLPKSAKERLKQRSMRVSIQRLIPWKTCADLMKARSAVLDETSFCLKPIETHHSPCTPDVGAPVTADDGIWGITSGWISKNCDIYPSPTVVTRTAMAPVRAWLESVL